MQVPLNLHSVINAHNADLFQMQDGILHTHTHTNQMDCVTKALLFYGINAVMPKRRQ